MDADDNVELDEIEVEPEEMPEEPEQDPDQSGDEQEGDESGDDEVTVSIGDEPPESEQDEYAGSGAPQWVKDLRVKTRELAKRNRELEQKLSAPPPTQEAVTLGPKPKLADFEYDEEKLDAELDKWYARKRDVDAQADQQRRAQEAAQNEWKAKLDHFGKLKSELKVSDFDDAQSIVEEAFSQTQQGIIVAGATNPAQVVYALGKNPTKAKELAAITDPVKFAFAVAQLETKLKVTPRKTAPIPDRVVRGSAPVPKGADKKLAELEAKADKTGDRTEYLRYKKALSSKG